jgi:hypothetical protein
LGRADRSIEAMTYRGRHPATTWRHRVRARRGGSPGSPCGSGRSAGTPTAAPLCAGLDHAAEQHQRGQREPVCRRVSVDHAEQPVELVGVLVSRLADAAEIDLLLAGRLVHQTPALRRGGEPRRANPKHGPHGRQQLDPNLDRRLLAGEEVPCRTLPASRLVEDGLPAILLRALGLCHRPIIAHEAAGTSRRKRPYALTSSAQPSNSAPSARFALCPVSPVHPRRESACRALRG